MLSRKGPSCYTPSTLPTGWMMEKAFQAQWYQATRDRVAAEGGTLLKDQTSLPSTLRPREASLFFQLCLD